MATITRADWGAPPNTAPRISTPVLELWLHHGVVPFWVGVQAARNLERIARDRGFLGISYSWLTDRAGNEIEGRGWGRQGAHTRGRNSISHALCLVGNLDAHPMPAGMIRGAVRLVRRHRRFGPGRITGPHSAAPGASTACPGRYARAQIPGINRQAAASSAPAASPGGFLVSLNDDQELWVWRWLRALQHKSSSPEWLAAMDDRVKQIEAELQEVKAQQPGKPLLVRAKGDKTIWLLLPEGRRRVDPDAEYSLLRYFGHAQASQDGTPFVLAGEQVAAYPVLDERSG